jgi:hypothetical protein
MRRATYSILLGILVHVAMRMRPGTRDNTPSMKVTTDGGYPLYMFYSVVERSTGREGRTIARPIRGHSGSKKTERAEIYPGLSEETNGSTGNYSTVHYKCQFQINQVAVISRLSGPTH